MYILLQNCYEKPCTLYNFLLLTYAILCSLNKSIYNTKHLKKIVKKLKKQLFYNNIVNSTVEHSFRFSTYSVQPTTKPLKTHKTDCLFLNQGIEFTVMPTHIGNNKLCLLILMGGRGILPLNISIKFSSQTLRLEISSSSTESECSFCPVLFLILHNVQCLEKKNTAQWIFTRPQYNLETASPRTIEKYTDLSALEPFPH